MRIYAFRQTLIALRLSK